jgi:alkylation response protein AidB-like acyl-CoA dehydrogenase
MTVVDVDEDLLARARSLRGLIETEAEQGADTMTAPVIQALRDTKLFWLLVPRELGGLETDVVTAISVFEELAYADGSTGWSMMANATAVCFAAIYLADEAISAMFGGAEPPIAAGMFGPAGTISADGDEYVLSGKFQFGSGIAHSDWFSAGAVELSDGEMAMSDAGLPSMRVSFLPSERVELRGNWDVMGLSATGSYDYAIDAERVDPAFTFLLLEATPHRGGPHYGLTLLGWTASGHAGFALGVGKRAMKEVLDIARSKQRLGGAPVAEQQLFQHDFAMHDAALRAARAYVLEAFGEGAAATIRDGAPTLLQVQRMRQATTYATRIAADATRFAYTWAGSKGLRPGVLQRCFRDIHASTQHVFVDNNTLTAYTEAMLQGAE